MCTKLIKLKTSGFTNEFHLTAYCANLIVIKDHLKPRRKNSSIYTLSAWSLPRGKITWSFFLLEILNYLVFVSYDLPCKCGCCFSSSIYLNLKHRYTICKIAITSNPKKGAVRKQRNFSDVA